jgi:hypothetical protein
MKFPSTNVWLVVILSVSLAVSAANLAMGDSFAKVAFRTIGLLVLFYFVLKGKNVARVLLAFLYGAAGLMLIYLLVAGWSRASGGQVVLFGLLAFFSCASSAFFWRSPVLRRLAVPAAKSDASEA